jgi:hypothetical protein
MKLFLLCIALFLGQMQPSQSEEVVRLPPHAMGIPEGDGGKMVELLHTPPALSLPKNPPRVTAKGDPWYVDIRNLGPNDVAVQGNSDFIVHLHPKDVVRIRAAGNTYSQGKP